MSLNNIIETFERPAEMASAFSSGDLLLLLFQLLLSSLKT